MAKNLVIVESPAKAKTIERFLGKDYKVTSCFGHIRDLPSGKISVDIEKDFEPKYEIPADKKKVVAELKKLAKDAEMIWLATDEDREGEAISWHLAEVLKLDESRTKRIVFHEITKNAITNAIKSPRSLNNNLVYAQQARRILDRLVGFEISPILWRKVRPSLSAGRVQSVAVRLIVEREREVNKFDAKPFFKLSADFNINDAKSKALLEAEYPSKIKTKEEAAKILEACKEADFKIDDIEIKPAKKSPSAPFTTSTLQQEASRKLGFSVSRTMTVAQKLYEAGHITYMRTDSMNLSETALQEAEEQIKKNYGPEYAKRRVYATKSKGAQEAHEAIRPTYLSREDVSGDAAAKRLYELIWKRTIASQMAEARTEKTNVKIGMSNHDTHFSARGEVLKFDGFLKVYIESRDEDEEDDKPAGMLPPLKKGQELELLKAEAIQRYTRPPARYTEASLVKKLEEMGIGRPSTYAPTISTVQKRGYVSKETREGKERDFDILILQNKEIKEERRKENFGSEKNKLFPTDIGIVVNDFLIDHFDTIMDYNFTAKVEKEFDEIAEGKQGWQKMLKSFYTPFNKTVKDTLEHADRAKGARLIGEDPKSGKNIFAKIGKYGPYVQLGEGEEDEKPKFAKLRTGQLLENITLEEALELFKLPRIAGQYKDKDVVIGLGRFGPYVKYENSFASIPKDEDPYTINLERCIELLEASKEAAAKKNINTYEYDGDTIKVLNGRFGPYISFKGSNYKIPKDKKAEELDLDACVEIINTKGAKSKGRKSAAKKKPAKKAATAKKKKS